MKAEMFTGALVSIFVERTIDTLASRFVHIFRARKHNKKRLNDLRTKLLAIDVVAYDAEQKQFRDSRVRDWLLRAKDVVFDAENLLGEIDYQLRKSQVEEESQSATNKVWNSLKSSFVNFSEIEIESRMEQLIEDLERLVTQGDLLGLKKGSGVGVGSGSGSKLAYTYLPNESVIYGRDDDREFIFNWFTSDTNKSLSILSIVGRGGVGKTSLAQHVFNDPRIQCKFDIKAWVRVPCEFDVFNVSRAILEGVTTLTDDSRDLEMIHRRLKEKLMGKKFLLILDDVWLERQSNWEDVKKPLVFGGQGSRIFVTTRSEKVAVTMRSERHHLKVLKKDDCWKLFAKHAFESVQPDPDFMEIGKKIVEKCNGLPVALKTMGSLLHNKSSLCEWESIMKSEYFSENESRILPALRVSYHHLPSHLKKCFAFCALFPKDFKFDKEFLILLWMAENFLESPLQKKHPKEVGEQYFNDLLSWSFFQKSTNEGEKYFIMHDMVHDLAKFVCEDICIRLGVDEPKENTIALTRQGIVRRLKNLEKKEKEKVGTQDFAINLADSEQTESRNVKKCRRNPERNTAAKTTSETTANQGSIFHGPTKKTTVENSTFPSKVGNGNVFENLETFFKTAREQHDEQGKALEQSQKDLKESKDTIAQLKKRLEDTEKERDEDYAKLLRVNEDYEKCREKRREDQFSWEKKENEFAQEKAELCATVEEAKDAIARSFGDGFDAAIEQAKILFPAIDFSALDPMKEVVDGQIVDG